jgi:hypothetical protein
MSNKRTLAGRCFCDAVHFVVADEFIYAANCHCSNCRRATGSAFKPFAGIESNKLTVIKGKDSLLIFGNDNANDAHCRVCGSLLYSVVRAGCFVHVAMGTLIDDPAIRPNKHIFVGSKAHGSLSPTDCLSLRNTRLHLPEFCSLEGQEHSRTIPLAETAASRRRGRLLGFCGPRRSVCLERVYPAEPWA